MSKDIQIHPLLAKDESFLNLINTEPHGELDINEFYNQLPVRIVGSESVPLFYASDICKILNISRLDKCKYLGTRDIVSMDDKQSNNIITYNLKGHRANNMILLTEFGVLKLILHNRSQISDKFEAWIYHVVYNIRRTGKFERTQQIQELNITNERILKENKTLADRNAQHQIALKHFTNLTDKIVLLRMENDPTVIQLNKAIPEEDQYQFDDDEYEISDDEFDTIDAYEKYAEHFPEDANDRKFSYKITNYPTPRDLAVYTPVLDMYVRDYAKTALEIKNALMEYDIGKNVYLCDMQKILNTVRGVCINNQ